MDTGQQRYFFVIFRFATWQILIFCKWLKSKLYGKFNKTVIVADIPGIPEVSLRYTCNKLHLWVWLYNKNKLVLLALPEECSMFLCSSIDTRLALFSYRDTVRYRFYWETRTTVLEVIKRCSKLCSTISLKCENRFSTFTPKSVPLANGNAAFRYFVTSEKDDVVNFLLKSVHCGPCFAWNFANWQFLAYIKV